MKCKSLIIVFGLLALAFLSFSSSSSVNALESYTYHLNTSTVPVNTVPNQYYLYVPSSSDYPNSSFPSYTNPFNFTPKYLNISFEYDPTNTSQNNTVRASFIGFHMPSTNSTVYNISLLSNIYPKFTKSFTIKLDDVASDLILTNTTTGGYYLSLDNVASCTNFCYRIASGSMSADVTFYDSDPFVTSEPDCPDPETPSSEGQYHNDLVNIQQAIITCGAVLLVLYFFYCIYRIIIKGGSL